MRVNSNNKTLKEKQRDAAAASGAWAAEGPPAGERTVPGCVVLAPGSLGMQLPEFSWLCGRERQS